ncbi:cytochrome c3 family protein [Desulfuribacillus alkaliarsenatis]|uniref:7-cyano-7-deazaguanine reductase n=1 Tax=Desulfuribacillus alkaliarsenatis TaxID=766136 RepID=A0A1E5G1E1_9FIRM|nr:NapC/NirT family cytochrome c [Desulfuribacillus alkaliarsenatis]OEF96730.1 7-cyano-7-deazaguanine reductase [Desulfuribacillus alkaliarsenatis]
MGTLKDRLKSANKWTVMFFALLVAILLYSGTAISMKATDTAEFCSSCHVMNEVVRTHQISTHANLTCNDCHAPHDILSKIPFKAKAGAKDIYINTFGEVSDVIQSTSKTKEIVNQNCLNCHDMTNKNVAMDAKDFCIDCHQTVPHFGKKPISERMVAGE